jgi:hypothetical protein
MESTSAQGVSAFALHQLEHQGPGELPQGVTQERKAHSGRAFDAGDSQSRCEGSRECFERPQHAPWPWRGRTDGTGIPEASRQEWLRNHERVPRWAFQRDRGDYVVAPPHILCGGRHAHLHSGAPSSRQCRVMAPPGRASRRPGGSAYSDVLCQAPRARLERSPRSPA